MEGVLLSTLGKLEPRLACPPSSLKDLDARVSHLQSHALEKSTVKGYSTGARDYAHFCRIHHLSLDPTPQTLSRYIDFTSLSIASGPKYLSGARHFLHSLYPSFNASRASPLVQATIRGSKKVRADPVRRKQPLRIEHLLSFVTFAHCTSKYCLPYHKTDPFFRGTDILF